MRDRFRQRLQDYFRVTATRQERLLDVYTVTAPNGKPPALQPRTPDGGGFRSSSVEFWVPGGLDEILDGPKPVSIEAITDIYAASREWILRSLYATSSP